MKGFKGDFLKKLTAKEKKTAIAYQDGKGGVTLGLTTFEQTRHWDLVLANPLDRVERDGDRLPWYSSIFDQKENNDQNKEHKHLFNNLSVEPLTIKQNTPGWFLLCEFSCTSSLSDQLLNEVKKKSQSRNMYLH
jgi:hypothetical protein